MIIFFPVDLKDFSTLEKKYPWPPPSRCPRCNRQKIWGHGFEASYFDGFHKPLFLKRYRCPDCKGVFKIRPKGYFKRFQASVETIRQSLETKAAKGKWLPQLSRSRQNHWFNALKRKTLAILGVSFEAGLAAFDSIREMGIIPVCRAI